MALTFPPIYLLKTRFEKDLAELVKLSNEIGVVHRVDEATIVLTKGTSSRRAQLDLSALGFKTEPKQKAQDALKELSRNGDAWPPAKRRKVEREDSRDNGGLQSDNFNAHSVRSKGDSSREKTIKVLRLEWYEHSAKAGVLQPFDNYVIYEGVLISHPRDSTPEPQRTRSPKPAEISSRAKVVASPHAPISHHNFGDPRSRQHNHSITRPTLLHETTSEHESPSALPPIPAYLRTNYSCQRPTPLYSPNEAFIKELKKIREARLLNGDGIGVRAYSSSIATLAAYPHTLTSLQEVLALPKCNQKIALLFQQWKETGHIPEVDEIEADPRLQVLKVFYDIWGVGATTAREFYDKGWRDLDDIVMYGWDGLNRAQQIGLKYYDEFLQKIPRDEVERIGEVILDHANRIRPGYQMVIVGGYRKGKPECGDVDVILSHPEEQATERFVEEIESSLVNDGWITHTLSLSTRNSKRGQIPVAWKGDLTKPGTGFDTLDKALVVWQNPDWPTKRVDLQKNPNAKNFNIHRRVDVIVSPWRTAGSAVLGWSGGTTFERDLRLYCKKEKNLKFDSSGIRSRSTGAWVDVETGPGDMLVKERRVFDALGLEWREPTDRCTG